MTTHAAAAAAVLRFTVMCLYGCNHTPKHTHIFSVVREKHLERGSVCSAHLTAHHFSQHFSLSLDSEGSLGPH